MSLADDLRRGFDRMMSTKPLPKYPVYVPLSLYERSLELEIITADDPKWAPTPFLDTRP